MNEERLLKKVEKAKQETNKYIKLNTMLAQDNQKLKLENNKLFKENQIQKNTLTAFFARCSVSLASFSALEIPEKKIRLPFNNVFVALEYMLLFQKLFEMYVFDYIIDRQNPDNKTEEDTKALIINCKAYTDKIIHNLTYSRGIDTKAFKKSFKEFAKRYVDEEEMRA